MGNMEISSGGKAGEKSFNGLILHFIPLVLLLCSTVVQTHKFLSCTGGAVLYGTAILGEP